LLLNTFLGKSTLLSALGPLLHKIQSKIAYQDSNSSAVTAFKKALQDDMASRYVDPSIKFLIHKASFLDPRSDPLIYNSKGRKILQEIMQLNECMQNEFQIESETENTLEPSDSSTPGSSTGKPTRKRKRKSALMELIGNKFQKETVQMVT